MQLFTAPELTPAQYALQTMQAIHNDVLVARANGFQKSFDLFWNNDRATPAQMAAALGTNAAAAFALHAATAQDIATQAPELFATLNVTPPLPYSFNNDGSMTVGS